MAKVLVVKIVKGKVESQEEKKGVKTEEVVKEIAKEVIKDWNPRKADLIIMKHGSKELVPIVKRSFPVYVISYAGVWEENGIKEREIIAVIPEISEEDVEEIVNALSNYTKA